MPSVRIYQRPKNAMQSGKARTDRWVVEFEPAEAKRPDPLTGWAGSGDTREQVLMNFASLEAAKAYAEREGLPFTVTPAPAKTLKLQDRKSVVSGKSVSVRVDLGGRRIIKKKQNIKNKIKKPQQ